MFQILFVLSLMAPVALAVKLGGRRALWICWPFALLAMPVWMNLVVGASGWTSGWAWPWGAWRAWPSGRTSARARAW